MVTILVASLLWQIRIFVAQIIIFVAQISIFVAQISIFVAADWLCCGAGLAYLLRHIGFVVASGDCRCCGRLPRRSVALSAQQAAALIERLNGGSLPSPALPLGRSVSPATTQGIVASTVSLG